MNVLLIGKNSPGDLGNTFSRNFSKQGCKVYEINDSEIFDKFSKNRMIKTVLFPVFQTYLHRMIVKFINNYDINLVLVMKGRLFSPTLLKFVKKSYGLILANYNPDDPFNLNEYGVSNKFVINSIKHYDYYFTYSRDLIPKIKRAGGKNVFRIPFACDPADYNFGSYLSDKALDADINFIGTADLGANRRRELTLSNLENYNIKIWGKYWGESKYKFIRDVWAGEELKGYDYKKVIRESLISLNILKDQNMDSHNMRTFEIPSFGGFMLSNRTEEQVEFFPEGKSAEYFDTYEELKDKVNYYINNLSAVNKIKKDAYKESMKHSYYDRVKSMIKYIRN